MNTELAQVSVIIPNYNHAAFLNERIESVLNQSFQNFELIILDDCSTDNSRSIIAQYKDHPKLTHIAYNDNNTGSPFIQWQKGINLSKGDYIWIAESDDLAHPDFLSVQLSQLESTPAAFSYCDSLFIDENGKHGEKISTGLNLLFHTNKWNQQMHMNGIRELESCLIDTCTILNVSSVLFKKTTLLCYLPKVLSYRSTGDWLMYMLIALEHDFNYTNLPLNYFRIHDSNTTKKATKNGRSSFERFYSRRKVLAEIKVMKSILPASTKKNLKSKLINKMAMELRFILSLCLRGQVPIDKFCAASLSFIFIKAKGY